MVDITAKHSRLVPTSSQPVRHHQHQMYKTQNPNNHISKTSNIFLNISICVESKRWRQIPLRQVSTSGSTIGSAPVTSMDVEPAPRARHCAVLFGSKMFLFGGVKVEPDVSTAKRRCSRCEFLWLFPFSFLSFSSLLSSFLPYSCPLLPLPLPSSLFPSPSFPFLLFSLPFPSLLYLFPSSFLLLPFSTSKTLMFISDAQARVLQ